MSGRKQHYIPQCLLRGFEAARSGKHAQVLVFRSGRQPYLSSTEGVAAERDFYSGLSMDDRKSLDDRITDYECRLGPLLVQLRNSVSGAQVDSSFAAEVVTHLTVRGAFIRDIFGLGLQEMLAGVSAFFANEESLRSWMGIDCLEPTQVLAEEIDRAIEALRPQLPVTLPPTLLRRVLLVHLRERFSSLHSQQAPHFFNGIAEFAATVSSVIRGGHIRVLDESLVPSERAQALASLHWTVQHIVDGTLILPDCLALSVRGHHENPYNSYLLDSNKELEQVLLPLSSNRLLVGSRDLVVPVAADHFNRWAAACSLDFFVSSDATDKIAGFAGLIGDHPRASIFSAVREAVAELHLSAEPQQDLDKSFPANLPLPGEDSEDVAGAAEPASYTVSFMDCADQETAERIAAVVGAVFKVLMQVMPLARVESITFAHDYATALQRVDRGFSTTVPLNPTDEEYGVGIAMAPIVLRDGKIRACIVMRAWLGDALLHEDDENAFATSLHTLSTMLARVAFIDLFDTALPGILLRPIRDNWNALLFKDIEEACSAYYSSRVSASLFPGARDTYCEVFLSVLEAANADVPKARLAYRLHGNLDTFLNVATRAIGRVLIHAAALIGHCDGLDLTVLGGNADVEGALERSELHLWIEVFQRDLDTLFNRRGRWRSLDEFTALSVHMERLLWQFGVFPWRTDAGGVRVEIPLAIDLPVLATLHTESPRVQ